MSTIDWDSLNDAEVAEIISASLAEGDRRIARMQEAMRYSPPKPGPGRPRTNGATVQD